MAEAVTCEPTPSDGFTRWPSPDRRCEFCRAWLHVVPMGDDDWQWLDADGQRQADAPDTPPVYRRDPAAWWDGLREMMKSKNDQVSTRAAQTYSNTKAFMDIYGIEPWKHSHYPETNAQPDVPGRRPPECCGWPMHAQPRGWVCRKNGGLVPYVNE